MNVIENILDIDGMRIVRVAEIEVDVTDAALFEKFVTLAVRKYAGITRFENKAAIMWRVCEPFMLDGYGQFFFVHFQYGGRISKAVEIAVDGWVTGTGTMPRFAYVKSMPKGVESGTEVAGVVLIEAGDFPANCCAVR